MTSEKQNIAIATACGWTDIREEDLGLDEECMFMEGAQPDGGGRCMIPFYDEDLNLMHDAEKTLLTGDPQVTADWEFHLRQVTLRDAHEGSGLYERIARATAAQRAEAFLRTIGKWEDDK